MSSYIYKKKFLIKNQFPQWKNKQQKTNQEGFLGKNQSKPLIFAIEDKTKHVWRTNW